MNARRRSAPQPQQPLELYEFEACPFCRKVREVMSELDLEYICYPSAKGSRHRQVVLAEGGKQQFPYLIDRNTGATLYESEAIISYLKEKYGAGRSILSRIAAPLNTANAVLASAIRNKGNKVIDHGGVARAPNELLMLFNFEASPYCRKVREVLNELDLPYHVKNVGKKSPRRPELIARGGKMQVPYIVDPNTGVEMYESDEIVQYLRVTYGQ